jgi:His-Xaa-Ser repeat protein HxsA
VDPLLPRPPAATNQTPKTLTGRSTLFKTIVMHVQVALMGQGLFDGPIDGSVGPKTRAALRVFQESHGLTVTGSITPQTLDALHVPSQ